MSGSGAKSAQKSMINGHAGPVSAARLFVAHADAWEVHGRIRAAGAVARLPGTRLMSSGLAHPQWNSADVSDVAAFDVEAVRGWYAERNVPWGVRVPSGAPLAIGRRLLTQPLMAVAAEAFTEAPTAAQVEFRRAGPRDLDRILAVDAAAFGAHPMTRQWIGPMLHTPQIDYALAECDGAPVGVAYVLHSDGEAGPCAYLAGVGVVSEHRRRGVAGALSSWLLAKAFDRRAVLAHLHPDTADAASMYSRLGFTRQAALDIYTDL